MKPSKKTQDSMATAKEKFATHLQDYMSSEHGLDIGRFEAEELFQEAFQEIAPLLYNQGLLDAKTFLQERFADISEDVIQLEIDTPQKSSGTR